MKRKILVLLICISASLLSYSQVERKIVESEVWYESVFDAEGLSSDELSEGILKFLDIKGFTLSSEDDRFIFAQGSFPAQYRAWAAFFFNTTNHNCTFDIKIEYKAGKVRYKASNLVLNKVSGTVNDVAVNVNVDGEQTVNVAVGERYQVNDYYTKINERHLLFQGIDSYMNLFDKELRDYLIVDQDW